MLNVEIIYFINNLGNNERDRQFITRLSVLLNFTIMNELRDANSIFDNFSNFG